MSTRSTNLGLITPAFRERNWHNPLDANRAALDASALGALAVTPAESPSASLNVRVSAGTFINAAKAYVAFAGSASYALPASATTHVWLTDAGALAQGAAWPSAGTDHVRLATVTTDATTVTAIKDERVFMRSVGS